MKDTTASVRWKWLVTAGVAGVAIVTTTVLAIVPRSPSPGNIGDVAAADDTAARQAWEARQQRVYEVLQELDLATLIGDSPTRGNLNAPVVLFEFSDFQCPFCAQAIGNIEPFLEGREDQVLFVYKHLPLMQIHPEALPASKAAWAAGKQGQFWAYHDALFASQERLGEDFYIEIAESLNLDMDAFNRDRASADAQEAIARDLALAETLGLNSTPTFIMNGLLIPGGVPTEFFEEAFARITDLQQP